MTDRLAIQHPTQALLFKLLETIPLEAQTYSVVLSQNPRQPRGNDELERWYNQCIEKGLIPGTLNFSYEPKKGIFVHTQIDVNVPKTTPGLYSSGAFNPLINGGRFTKLKIEFDPLNGRHEPESIVKMKHILPYARNSGYELESANVSFGNDDNGIQRLVINSENINGDGVILCGAADKESLDQELVDWFSNLKEKYKL